MTTAQDRLNQILPSWYDLLTQWSLDGSLVAAATDALMLESSNAKDGSQGLLQSYVSQWSAGNFKNLPQIVLLSAEDISGAYGAYADSTDTIYLNQEWLLGASAEDIQKVLTHELGHYLDDQLKEGDTEGDEGQALSYLIINDDLANIKPASPGSNNDHIIISIDGNYIEAQAYAPILYKEWETASSDAPLLSAFQADTALVHDYVNGGVFAVGKSAPYEFIITKISESGKVTWKSSADVGSSVAFFDTLVDGLGGFYAAGSVDGPLNNTSPIDPAGNLVNDGFLTSYNPDGSIKWTKLYGGQGEDVVADIELLPNGNILMSAYRSDLGWSLSEVSASNGEILSTNQLSTNTRNTLVDNNGVLYSIKSSGPGPIISRHNGYTSSIQWQVDLTSVFGPSVLFDWELMDDGSLVVAGRVNSSSIAVQDQYGFLASVSSAGDILWSKAVSTNFLNISDIEIGKDTNIYLLGSSDQAGGSFYTAAFDSSGSPLWKDSQLFNPSLALFNFEVDRDRGFYFGTGGVTKYTRDYIQNIGPATFRINGNETGQDAQTLTCSLDQLDPDGMTKLPPSKTGDPTTGYSYQWQISSDEVNWSNATGTGATTFKYSVNTTSDANKFLRVQVGYTDDKGFIETVYTEQVKIISGTTKSDKFAGTAGVEVTFSGSGADAVATGAGNDFAKGGIGNDTFIGADEDGDDFFDGQSEIDTIDYSASSKGVDIDFVTGLATERTDGGIGKDSFAGIENARGSTGADSFKGSTGVNVFTGSGGADTFIFANAQIFGKSTSDRITDISSDDKIQVSASAFGIVDKPYSFAAVSGTKAVNAASALIVYDTGSGYLYLNKDGATSGMGGGGIFAVLDNKFAGLAAGNVSLI